ncbi:putative transcriptional regulator [Sphingobium yanoikuyae]|uniref:Putative transcriptional regulator n=1 Tax=Sphingobium yanoikuyae TaxID=13690 RepID=A0A084E240_SPHYA|nr:LysR family transcriptional regulator [Sphingobium yanoikuyae]KEZ12032.1 putative transcriptional regulator [Sphingobium yanoikuyae]
MELRHLRYFEAVAAERNFTRAAERLGVAQPPLSRQIRELEIELGVALFDRDSRPIRLTEAGRIFHEQATRILSSIEQLRRSMQRLTQSAQRRFVVGFVGSIVYGMMPGVIREFRARADGLEIQLLEMSTIEQVVALKDGRIDAGLGRILIDDPAIQREVLQDEPLIAAIGTADTLAAADSISLSDLMARKLLVYPSQPRPSYADQVLTILRDHGLTHTDVEEVRDVQVTLGLVASEAGVALVPSSMRHVQHDDIIYVRVRDEGATSPIILSFRVGDSSADVRLFEQIARQLFR